MWILFDLTKEADRLGKSIQVTVSEQEKKLIDLIRNTKHGELKILIRDCLPIRVEEMKKSIKL